MILPIIATGIVTGVTYEGYKRSSKPSKFEIAAGKLGFTSSTQQEALLKIFYLAGYFEPEKLWHDLVCFDKTNADQIFRLIQGSLTKAGADQKAPSKFNAKSLHKNLFKSTNEINVQNVEDWLLFIAQNAFDLNPGQERNELTSEDWMTKYASQYIEAAKQLGLINEIKPNYQEYDEAWIAGAARISLLTRIIYYNKLTEQIKVNGSVLILTGVRPLWANIDGINPKIYTELLEAWQGKADINKLDTVQLFGNDSACIEEGERYIESLAKDYGIKLNKAQPFIQYKTQEECPSGLFPIRLYPNYASSNEREITETLMSSDLVNKFLNKDQVKRIEIINTKVGNNNERPDTATTAHDAAVNFAKRILSRKFGRQKDFVILFVSNNPHIERQTIVTQREVDKVLQEYGLDKQGYHIRIAGVGASAIPDIPVIHSELGELITAKWINKNRPLAKLAYAEEFEGDAERRTAAYLSVREDSSTASTYKLPAEVEFCKRSNLLSTDKFGHSIDHLMFQTRKDFKPIPPMPEIKK
ncbi:MAG: palindromic element RPE1 domain-containing protein [Rickettsia endosymbiont of Labidopullus appendiculatus]|nr:palindromic element RPE1 domain-containing protein [Rickettsia endosymbiont of Labidopullus appendiculatus]